MDILDVLESNANLYPDKSVYRFLDKDEVVSEQLSYRQLNTEIAGISSQLRLMYPSGARVLVLLPAEAAFIRSFLALLHAGLIAVPCPIGYSESGIGRILNIIDDCEPVALITNRKTHKMLLQRQNNATKALSAAVVDWLFSDDLAETPPPFSSGKIEREVGSIAYLQYTSGSTSRPKGVMVSHANLIANLSAINHCFGRTAADTSVTWLPHYHDMGLVDGLLSPLFTGGTGVVISPLVFVSKPFLLLRAISEYRAGFCGGPGFGLDHCVSRIAPELLESIDLRSLQVLYVGAEPIRISSLERFAERMRSVGFRRESLVPAYGLAEATLAVSLHYHGQPLNYQRRAGINEKEVVACGPPVENTLVMIVDPVSMEAKQAREIGEIWVKNNAVALGYWQNEAATSATFGAFTREGIGPFLRTGDLGFLDQGELFITGRAKEVIIIRGVNYYPQDIEEIVSECHESIQPNASAAFSVETEEGEALMIVSEIKRDAAPEERIKHQVAQSIGLAFGLLVHQVVLLPPGKLPKTSSGKIQRLKAREIWAENCV